MSHLLTAICILVFLMAGCRSKNQVNPRLADEMPQKILWAWERPEDLTFLDPNQFGVAFLAQTVFLENNRVTPRKRRQPLDVAPNTYMIAVTRIETNKETANRPTLDPQMAEKTAGLIKSTLDLPGVRSVQVDFDAVTSERAFYRQMMDQLKRILPPETPLTMTSLASWCTGDAWFNDFPVDEAVPMVFQMGDDDEKIKAFLRNGNDWPEPLCRGSYGVSIDETPPDLTKTGRRMYYFKNSPWTRASVASL